MRGSQSLDFFLMSSGSFRMAASFRIMQTRPSFSRLLMPLPASSNAEVNQVIASVVWYHTRNNIAYNVTASMLSVLIS